MFSCYSVLPFKFKLTQNLVGLGLAELQQRVHSGPRQNMPCDQTVPVLSHMGNNEENIIL